MDWFDEMERRYAELDPRPDDPAEYEKWVTRCHKWATAIDPEGSLAAFEAMCEEGVAQGLLVRTGVNADGRPLYRRTDKKGG
jgi:hypothetical protein